MSQRSNPFPGLRSFRSDEDYLFFGREGQSDDLLRLLQQSRFLAVVGVSGSGKSSLVRAGLLPSLVGGLLSGAGSRWRIAMLRPGSEPIANLAQALLHPEQLATTEEIPEAATATLATASPGNDEQAKNEQTVARDAAIRAAFVDATLRRGGLGLAEAAAQLPLLDGENLLVVVDQFEEIFRYAATDGYGSEARLTEGSADEESAHFVRLLLEASQSQLASVYVVITMRSDFLGDCAQFPNLPEAINRAQYLIPRMTREQRRQAIEGPVAVGGATIAPRLVQRLLNDVGDSPDQLPILQHALMRTWVHWEAAGDPAAPIDLPHYEATGGMAQALSQHADEVYRNLPDERSRQLAKAIFKGLTHLGADKRGLRRPVTLEKLCELTAASQTEVLAVLAPFRQANCAFIAPPDSLEVSGQSTLDISHESLMRIWQQLGQWVEEEAQDALWLRRLSEAAQLYERNEAGLWRDPQLTLALAWQAAKQPTPAWAARYIDNFAASRAFLDTSQQTATEEAAHLAEAARALEAARQQELEHQQQVAEMERRRADEIAAYARRLRWLVAGLAVAVLAAIVVAWVALDQSNLATARSLVTEARNQPDLRLATLLALEARSIAPRDSQANQLLTHDLLSTKPLIYVDHIREFVGDIKGDYSIAWSPDSQTLAFAVRPLVGSGGTIGLKDIATGKTFLTFQGEISGVSDLAWSPNGKMLASASSNMVKLWDVATGKEIATLGHTDVVSSVAWSPDGRRLASASYDSTVKLWEASTGKELATLRGHMNSVYSVAWSPDGKTLASGSMDSTVKLWEIATSKQLTTLQGHVSDVTSVAWSPDGKILASASMDRTIRLWEVTTRKESVILYGHTDGVLNLAWSTDGQIIASASIDSNVRLWEATTGKPIAKLQEHNNSVGDVAWSPDGQTLASSPGAHFGSFDNAIRLWKVKTVRGGLTLYGHTSSVTDVGWSVDGKTLTSASTDDTIKVWDVTTGGPLSTLKGHLYAFSIAWGLDGRTLAFASGDNMVKLWEVVTGGHTSYVASVAWSPDGRTLASASGDRTVKLWDVATGKELATLQGHTDNVSSVAWSPDGRALASASGDDTVKLWDVATGREIATLQGHTSYVASVAWSPDGRTLASASGDDTVKLWDVATGKELATLWGHTDNVSSVAWSPDGRTLASASGDRTVKLWEVATGKELATLQGHTDNVSSVAWSPDGTRLASASADRTVKLWPLESIENPCTFVYANLSVDEWINYRQWAIYRATCPHLPTPPLTSVWQVTGNRKFDLLFITWQRRFAIVGLLLVSLVLVALWFGWLYRQLSGRRKMIYFILAVTGLTVVLPVYRLAFLRAPLILFDRIISLPHWQIYLGSFPVGVAFALFLWGCYEMVSVKRRALFTAVVVLLLVGWAYIARAPAEVSVYSAVVAVGMALALLLWGVFRVLRWLFNKLRRRNSAATENL